MPRPSRTVRHCLKNPFVPVYHEQGQRGYPESEVREMKIIIEGEAKEIAALVLAVQERQNTSAVEAVSAEMLTRLQKSVDGIR